LGRLSLTPEGKSSLPSGALLSLDEVSAFDRPGAIDEFWRKLLEIFVVSHCDSFSLSGIHGSEDLTRIECFADWQPKLKDRLVTRVERDVPSTGRARSDATHTRFALDVDAIDRLMCPRFHDWFVSSEPYPVDKLCFFQGSQLVVDAEPNELAILFYELTPARRDLLFGSSPLRSGV
jgi:hypothetical protein